jgi:hypothetical protein
MKEKIIELLKNNSLYLTSDEYDGYAVCDDRFEKLAEEIDKLYNK